VSKCGGRIERIVRNDLRMVCAGGFDDSMTRWLDGSMARWLDGSMAGIRRPMRFATFELRDSTPGWDNAW